MSDGQRTEAVSELFNLALKYAPIVFAELQALGSKAGLTDDEIDAATAKFTHIAVDPLAAP